MTTWDDREMPILQTVLAAEDAGEEVNLHDLAVRTGLEQKSAQSGLRALYEANYVTGLDVGSMGMGFQLMDIRLLERGRRAVGQWPSDNPFESLVELLDTKIAGEEDSDAKSKLARLRDALLGLGKDVGTALLIGWAKQQTGLA